MLRFFRSLFLSCSAIFICCSENNLRNHDGLDPMDGEREENFRFHTHVFRENIPALSSRTDVVKKGRVRRETSHEVIFAIKQKNMDELTSILHDISDPSSPNYGQHWTWEEVTEFTSNPEARDTVISYLNGSGAAIKAITLGGEYITASAPIVVWERMFNTEFFSFHQTQRDERVEIVTRAEKYWIPRELDVHVDTVFNIINIYEVSHGNLFPTKQPHVLNGRIKAQDYSGTSMWSYGNIITPYKLKKYYNMDNELRGINFSTQAIFASSNMHFSPNDAFEFQSTAGLPRQTIASTKNANDTFCKLIPESCGESSLDLQYIMGMSPLSPTTHWYTDAGFTGWLVAMANIGNPPLVLSISYGHTEASNDNGTKSSFNIQAIKFAAMGVTMFVASGDDGANSYTARWNISRCGYAPDFPSVSPYITAVGATSVTG